MDYNFHTIKSILNTNSTNAQSLTMTNFHTIKSILNQIIQSYLHQHQS